MAEKKPFIAARLRNPAEEAATESKPVKKAGFDIVGNIGAFIAFGLAAWLLITLMQDLDAYNIYLNLVPNV